MRILIHCDRPEDGTSFYRAVGPYLALKQEYPDIEFEVISPNTNPNIDFQNLWSIIWQFDIVVIQRPATHHALNLMVTALKHHRPIIVDFDDLLTAVPETNPNSEYYNSKEIRAVMAKILGLQTKMKGMIARTVSTDHLGYNLINPSSPELGVMPIPTHTIPNALYLKELGECYFAVAPSSECEVSWRGSGTHQQDLMEYMSEINRSFKSVEYIGFRPAIFREGKDVFVKPLGIIDYYIDILKKRNRKYFFVTLEDCSFNRSKSNIAWLEATWAGAVVLAPDWEEWKRPGIINYSSKEDFVEKAKYMLALTDKERRELWQQSADYIHEHLVLSGSKDANGHYIGGGVNTMRYDLISSMINESKGITKKSSVL